MSRARDFADLAGSADAGGLTGRNLIINGACVIDQRNSGSSVTTSGSYPVDRFFVNNATDATFSAQQSTDVPSGQGFTTSLKITFPTGDASIGTTQYANIQQYIEGFNVANLGFGNSGAKTVTLSFWVKASVTGQYSYAIYNSAEDRVNPQAFTINTADTWEFKSITYTGDTTGTWLTTSGIGIKVSFDLGSGANSQTSSPGIWQSTNSYTTSSQANWIGTAGATFYITGVQFEIGTQATAFDWRPYTTELQLCQRYYYRLTPGALDKIFNLGYGTSTTVALLGMPFPVTMRTAPSALEQSGTATDYSVFTSGGEIVCSAVPAYSSFTTTAQGFSTFTVASGLGAGTGFSGITNATTAYLGWSAEL